MSLFHAVVWTDHQSAQVLQFDPEQVKVHKVKAHSHPTAQHGSQVRSEHEFFGELCDSLDGIAEAEAAGRWLREQVRENPLTSLLIAGGIGAFLGAIFLRR